MAQKVPPVPAQAPVTDKDGKATAVWADFFNQMLARVGGNAGSDGDWANAKSASGYQKFPSGIVVQWGITASLASGTTTEITFPTAFDTGCLQVITGLRNISAAVTTDTGHHGSGGYSTTKFDLYNRTASAYTFNWLAIGY